MAKSTEIFHYSNKWEQVRASHNARFRTFYDSGSDYFYKVDGNPRGTWLNSEKRLLNSSHALASPQSGYLEHGNFASLCQIKDQDGKRLTAVRSKRFGSNIRDLFNTGQLGCAEIALLAPQILERNIEIARVWGYFNLDMNPTNILLDTTNDSYIIIDWVNHICTKDFVAPLTHITTALWKFLNPFIDQGLKPEMLFDNPSAGDNYCDALADLEKRNLLKLP